MSMRLGEEGWSKGRMEGRKDGVKEIWSKRKGKAG